MTEMIIGIFLGLGLGISIHIVYLEYKKPSKKEAAQDSIPNVKDIETEIIEVESYIKDLKTRLNNLKKEIKSV